MAAPELYISAEDHAYIKVAVKKASHREVGFLGIVEITGEEDEAVPTFGQVNHLRILKQETSSGEVEFDDEAFADYLEWLYTPVAEGGAGYNGTRYGLFSAHSHGNMGTFWSSTDEDAIKKYGISAPWVFSSVFNTRSESTHRLDVFAELAMACPIVVDRPQITFKDAKLWVLPHPSAQPIIKEIEKTEEEYEKRINDVKTPVLEAEALVEEAKKAVEKANKDVADAVKSVEKERDESVKALKDGLKDATEGVLGGIQDRVDDDFKQYVSHSHWGTNTRNGKPGGGSSGKASGPQSQKALSASSSGGSGKGKGAKSGGVNGANGDPYARDSDLNKIDDPYRLIYKVFDSDLSSVYGCTLQQVLKDNDLVLLEAVEPEVIDRLTDDEIRTLIRSDKGDYLDLSHATDLLDRRKEEKKKKNATKAKARKEPLADDEGEHVHSSSKSKSQKKEAAAAKK